MPLALPCNAETLAARLRPAILIALTRLAPDRADLRARFAAFARRHAGATLQLRPLAVYGRSPSWEQARTHASDAAALEMQLADHPVAAAVEWGAAPSMGPDDIRLATATATALALRIVRLTELERNAALTLAQTIDGPIPPPYLHPDALAAWAPYAAATGQGWGRYLARAFAASRIAEPDAFAEGWHDWVLEVEDVDLDAVLEAVVRELAGPDGGDKGRVSPQSAPAH